MCTNPGKGTNPLPKPSTNTLRGPGPGRRVRARLRLRPGSRLGVRSQRLRYVTRLTHPPEALPESRRTGSIQQAGIGSAAAEAAARAAAGTPQVPGLGGARAVRFPGRAPPAWSAGGALERGRERAREEAVARGGGRMGVGQGDGGGGNRAGQPRGRGPLSPRRALGPGAAQSGARGASPPRAGPRGASEGARRPPGSEAVPGGGRDAQSLLTLPRCDWPALRAWPGAGPGAVSPEQDGRGRRGGCVGRSPGQQQGDAGADCGLACIPRGRVPGRRDRLRK